MVMLDIDSSGKENVLWPPSIFGSVLFRLLEGCHVSDRTKFLIQIMLADRRGLFFERWRCTSLVTIIFGQRHAMSCILGTVFTAQAYLFALFRVQDLTSQTISMIPSNRQ